MNKRQIKKQNRALMMVNGLPSGKYTIYIKQKFWNKGSRKSGVMTVDHTDDFITMDYAMKNRYKYFVSFNNCGALTIQIAKSPNNTNRIVKHW